MPVPETMRALLAELQSVGPHPPSLDDSQFNAGWYAAKAAYAEKLEVVLRADAIDAPYSQLPADPLTSAQLRRQASEWRRWVKEGTSYVPTMHQHDAEIYERLADALDRVEAQEQEISRLRALVETCRMQAAPEEMAKLGPEPEA